MRESKGCQMRTPHATRGSHKRRTKSGQVIHVSKGLRLHVSILSKYKSNGQQLIQSNNTSHPQNKKGKAHTQVDERSRTTRTVNRMYSAFPNKWPFSYPKLKTVVHHFYISLQQSKTGSVKGSCCSGKYIAEDHIHTDITCNIEETKQQYRHGTVSNRLLGAGGERDLNMFYWTSASAVVRNIRSAYFCGTIYNVPSYGLYHAVYSFYVVPMVLWYQLK